MKLDWKKWMVLTVLGVLIAIPLSMHAYAGEQAQAEEAPVIVSIAAGSAHGIAAWSDGSVSGWGFNKHGQVGDGTQITQVIPKWLQGLPPIVQVAANDSQSYALDKDGGVWAWGETYTLPNYDKTGQYYTRTLPIQLDGVHDAVSIQTGGMVSAAIRANGEVVAWYPSYDYDTHQYTTVYLKLKGIVMARSVAISGSLIYVLKQDGTVRYVDVYNEWAGRFGTADELKIAQIMPVTSAKAIASSHIHAFILLDNGNVLDYNSWDRTLKPLAGVSNAYDIKGIYNHLVVLQTNGTVWQWNFNDPAQTRPTKVEGLSHITAITGNNSLLNFAIQKGGKAFVWGIANQWNAGTGSERAPTGLKEAQELLPPMKWFVNGEPVDFPGSASIFENQLYVPYTSVFEKLGIRVSLGQSNPDPDFYNQRFSVWTMTYQGKTLVFKATNPTAIFVDGKQVNAGESLRWVSDSTQFPLAYICKEFGISLQWDSSSGVVSLYN